MQVFVAADAKLWEFFLADEIDLCSSPPCLETVEHSLPVKSRRGLSRRCIRSQWARQLPPATVVHAPCVQATHRRMPGPLRDEKIPSKKYDGVALQHLRIVYHAFEQEGVRLGT